MGLKSYNGGVGGGDGGGVGEIVEVQGGHIIRATGRKDRHSKVFTSKGPRDRRVRLSAHTAIQFYDVQDRLGYDRPSKAVDWLIKKAKSAIDKLEISAATTLQESDKPGSSSEANLLFQNVNTRDNQTQTQAETQFETPLMSTFFPATSGTNSNINFQSYHPHDDIVSRTSNLSQDLGLSLHPFQGNTSSATDHQSTLFTTPFETNSFGRFYSDLANSEHSRNGFLVNHNHQQPSMMTLLNSQQQQPQQLFLGGQQRGTLQSSFHSWDHHHQHQHHHNQTVTDPNQASVMFASQFGSHSHGMIMQGLSFQSRIHGDGGQATQPNSSSSPPN